MTKRVEVVVGIDASNSGSGGIINYLIELLKHAKPLSYGIKKVVIWAPTTLLDRLDDETWLEKRTHPLLQKNVAFRNYWQKRYLPKELSSTCDLLYVPAGIYSGSFTPYVVACMNMLPFEQIEQNRYRYYSWWRLKMSLIKRGLIKSFRSADGVVLLSKYADTHFKKESFDFRSSTIINFGARQLYFFDHKTQLEKEEYTKENPFKILYISPITAYKHQGVLAEAISRLHKEGYHVQLNLCGKNNYQPTLDQVNKVISESSDMKDVIMYHGFTSHELLLELRKNTDAYAFSSSCENMPTILIEYMSSGRPIACSNMGPMPEFLEDAGFYYDPTSSESTYLGLKSMIDDVEGRKAKAIKAQELTKAFKWEDCSNKTLQYLRDVYKEYQAG